MNSILSAAQRDKLHQQLEEMLKQLPEGLQDLEEAERRIMEGMRSLAQNCMEEWASSAARKEAAPECPDCGRRMRHRGWRRRSLVTVVGTIRYARARRRCDVCGREAGGRQERLCFRGHGVTWRAAEKIARLASLLPSYEQARRMLMEECGMELSKQSIEAITQEAGQLLLARDDAAREACFSRTEGGAFRGPKESAISPEMVVVYADGTMIHAEGQWREIRVGRVAAYGRPGEIRRQRSFARFLPLEEWGQQMYVEAHGVGYGRAKKRAFLGDGAHWLWELAALHFPDAVPILDWYHLKENVYAAAEAVFGEGTEESRAWAEGLLADLSEGRQETARQEVNRLRRQMRGPRKREALRKLGVYLKNNAERMDYPRYRAAGLPIGSGPVEAACKALVGGRCKQSGMRNWTRVGAEAVLRLRAAQYDNEYHDLWTALLASPP